MSDSLDFTLHLGALLRELRAEQHMTLAELSAKAHVAVSHISDIERGATNASIEVVEALSRALRVSLPSILRVLAYRMERTLPATNITKEANRADISALSHA